MPRGTRRKLRAVYWTGRAVLQAAGGGPEQAAPPQFEVRAYNGEPILPDKPDWLDYPIVIDCAGLRSPDRISAVVDHGRTTDRTFGQTTRVAIGRGTIDMRVLVTGDLTAEGSPARNIVTQAANGMEWPVSLGARMLTVEFIEAGASAAANGRTYTGPLYILRQGQLYHIAFVSDGADQTASARIAASAAKTEGDMDFHEWLKEAGFEPGDLSEKQRTKLEAQFQREQELEAGGADDGDDPPDAKKKKNKHGRSGETPTRNVGGALEASRRENERVYNIQQRVAQFAKGQSNDVIDLIEAAGNKAIDENWSDLRLENELLKATARRAINAQPGAAERGRDQDDPLVIEAAFARTLGLANLEQHYEARTLDMANRRYRAGISICELLMMAAGQNGAARGLTVRSNLRQLLQAAFRVDGLEASGPSTLSIPTVLSNVANKTVEQHFLFVDQAWRQLCRIRPAVDFKESTSISLTSDLQFKKLLPGGKIEHGKLGEATYGNKVDTYARILGISRPDLINDDASALNNVLELMGRGGALALCEEVWRTWNDNSAFFASGYSNLLSGGAATALSPTSLKNALAAFRKLKDPAGKIMGSRPRLLVVPSDLETLAATLMQSMDIRELQDSTNTGAAAKSYGTANVLRGKYDICASPYAGDTDLGGSTTAWYLLADPNDVPGIEVRFLNGQQMPTVESAEANFDQLGIDIRGFYDFGVRKQEPRCGIKAPGA